MFARHAGSSLGRSLAGPSFYARKPLNLPKHAPQHSDFIESSGFKGSTGSLELIAMYVLPFVIFSVSIIQSNFVF